jgi:cytochrome c5
MHRSRKHIFDPPLCGALLCIAAIVVSSGIGLAQTPANTQKDQPQIDEGKKTVGEVCVACHTNILRMVQIHEESPGEWRDTVYSMVARGAQLTPDEIGSVTAYLVSVASKSQPTASEPEKSGRSVQAGSQQTGELEGRAVLQRTCQQCHDLATATAKLTNEDWNAIIARMTGYGARLSPGDQQNLIEYLEGLAK